MQKIVFFGGTGMTGQCAVRYALKKGLTVRLLVRNEATVPEDFKAKVELVKGDVTNVEDVKKAVAGQELVCVVLGTRNDLKPTTAMSDGMTNIITAMKEASLKRFSVCLSSFLFMEPEKVPAIFVNINGEHRRMLEAVKGCGLEYRAVLPPHIADEPQAKFDTAYDKSPGQSRSISKLDLGQFLVDCLFEEAHAGKVIGILQVEENESFSENYAKMAKTVDLLNIDVDQLFKQHNVAEIDLVHKRLLNEIELKREELRTMVGERYRDLLKAADTIGDMKQTAGSIIGNIDRITVRCQQLNDHNLIGFRTGTDYQRMQKKHRDHNFHGVIVQIKLLTGLPEMIWSSIDREDYFVATQLFIFARHISTGLSLDTERETMRKFPVAAKQWQVLSQFFFTIEAACRESLGREELSVAVAAKSLASWLLLESCPVEQTLSMFTERRSKAFLDVLAESEAVYEKVKDKLLASLKVVIGTVRLFYECFIDDGTEDDLLVGGFQRELQHITGDKAAPTIGLIRSEDPMIMQMVPEMIAKFRPRLERITLEEEKVRAAVSAFLKSIETAVAGRLKRLVSLVPSIKTLHDIKMQAIALEKPSHWGTITARLGLPEGTDFYATFYQRLINDRMQSIIKSAWTETVQQTRVDVLHLLNQKPVDLKAFVWKESLDDVPLNLKTALDRSVPSNRRLLMKARGYTPALVELSDSLNGRLQTLTCDVGAFLSSSSSRVEIEEMLSYFRQCCVEGIAELITAIKSAEFEPTVERYATLARFLTAVRELCPALRECFIPTTIGVLPDRWPSSGRKSSSTVAVSEEDPDRWSKVSGLLEDESLQCWTLWVERFQQHWPSLPVAVGYGTLLNDFPVWETVTIEENDENNQPIQSTIRVPSQPSFPVQKCLHHIHELLNDAIPQTIPRPTMLLIVERLAGILLAHYTTLADDSFVKQNQTVALQFYLDSRFLQLMLIGRDQRQLSESFNELVGRFKSYIDPFDFDVFYAHLNANVKRSVLKLQHFLGALICHSEQLATVVGSEAGVLVPSSSTAVVDKNPNILALSSNSLNLVWFPLLPVVSKETSPMTVVDTIELGSASGRNETTFTTKDSRKTTTGDGAAKQSTTKEATTPAATAQNYAKGAAAFFGLDKDWFR
uniref:Conserved oligomeric Golgi complex subunit 1 n=1 Tax=Anopheles stephensi TaxID=30069 RepID=A0A182YBC7_ANOST